MYLLSGNSKKLDKREVPLIIPRGQFSDPVITMLLENIERKVMKQVSQVEKHVFTLRIYHCKDFTILQ